VVFSNASDMMILVDAASTPVTNVTVQAANRPHRLSSGAEQACHSIHRRIRYAIRASLDEVSVHDVSCRRACVYVRTRGGHASASGVAVCVYMFRVCMASVCT